MNMTATADTLHKAVLHLAQEHQRRYGYRHANREIEIVTLRLRAVLESRKQPPADPRGNRSSDLRPAAEARVIFDGPRIKTKLYARAGLGKSKSYRGPAIVTEYSATTVVPPGKTFRIDAAGNLIIRDS